MKLHLIAVGTVLLVTGFGAQANSQAPVGTQCVLPNNGGDCRATASGFPPTIQIRTQSNLATGETFSVLCSQNDSNEVYISGVPSFMSYTSDGNQLTFATSSPVPASYGNNFIAQAQTANSNYTIACHLHIRNTK